MGMKCSMGITAWDAKSKDNKDNSQGQVSTHKGGLVTVSMEAHVPLSNARSSVAINLSSGPAAAQVSAQEPPKMTRKLILAKRTRSPPAPLLSSRDSDGGKKKPCF